MVTRQFLLAALVIGHVCRASAYISPHTTAASILQRRRPRLLRAARSRRATLQEEEHADVANEPPLGVLANEDDAAVDDAAVVDDAAGRFSASDYLSTLSRLSDDGRALLRAPQRYSSQQWVNNLLTLQNCNILRAVQSQLLWQCAWSLLVTLVYIRLRALPSIPALPHSLLGGVLGVLLGFRTNQSYDRFWEARKLWGTCFHSCRNMARSSLAYLDSDTSTYDTIQRYLKAFPVALKQHLRGELEIGEFRGTLDGQELNELSTADNLPLSVRIRIRRVHATNLP